jgi:pimeloyl-ACP methyl ester carboxylesterase
MHARVAGASLVLLALLCGCGDDGGPDDADGAGADEPSAISVEERCDSGVPDDATVSTTLLDGGDELSLLAATFQAPDGVEESGTVLVLLHQSGTFGLCGWGRFAAAAAATGVRSVAVDMCGFGGSECAEGAAAPPADQVDLAAAHARDELGAEHVVLVGSSMGGSQAVVAVAGGAEVDAWVDLSGPSVWEGATLADLAPEVKAAALPGLVVHAPDDGPEEFAAARALAQATGAEFREGESGHGYELLLTSMGGLRPDGEHLLAWVTGR